MSKGMGRWAIARHLSAADERFALLLLLVRASWAPLRRLDTGAAEAFNRIDAAQPGLTRAAEVVSDVFGANVFRVALRVIALVYLIHGERHHAT
jgi:undecaprenyl-diphosphatase